MYLAFDKTDDFAHADEYAAYLNAANYTDRFINYAESIERCLLYCVRR